MYVFSVCDCVFQTRKRIIVYMCFREREREIESKRERERGSKREVWGKVA